MRTRRPLSLLAAATIGCAGLMAAPSIAMAAPVENNIVINEVVYDDVSGSEDAIELYNAGSAAVDLAGWSVHDDKDRPGEGELSGSIAPGEFLVLNADVEFTFGLGKGDSVVLKDASGAEVDRLDYENTAPLADWSRCEDGTGAWAPGTEVTLGAANNCEPVEVEPTPAELILNEIDSSPADWVEFTNPGDEALDISGFEIRDNSDDHRWRFPAGTSIAPGEYLVVDAASEGEYFDDATDTYVPGTFETAIGIGSGDSIRVYDAAGTLIQNYSWTEHPAIDGDETAATWSRYPDATGNFTLSYATPGAANEGVAPSVAINEIESNGDLTDWAEIMNTGATAIDISGWTLMDNDPIGHAADVTPLADGTTLQPGEFFVFDGGEHFTFGLGAGDTATIRDAAGVTVAEHSYAEHADGVLARCPDGTGDFVDVAVATKGEANSCGNPVVLNEVESSDAAGGDDWIELYNPLDEPLDVSGLGVMDSNDRDSTIAAGTVIEANGYLVLTESDFGFGLGGSDEVRIVDGDTVVEQTAWTEHADATWGRCPDTTGDYGVTSEPTPGERNKCAGIPDVMAWPGSQDVTVQDTEPTFLEDSSGLEFADGVLWAVDNGTGTIWKLDAQADGSVSLADGWADGKRVRYAKDADNPDAAGPDTEGITVDGDGLVYVASERDNSDKGVNYNSVLVVDPNEAGPDLIAQHEWDLTSLLPAVNANVGIEAVEWVSNDALGDQLVGEQGVYDPANYPNAVADGVFFVALEDNGHVYAFVFNADGSAELVADLDPQIGGGMGLDYDEALGVLWVEADDGYNGRLAQLTLNGTTTPDAVHIDRPTSMENLNNEGFAVASIDFCVDGQRPAWWFADGVQPEALRSAMLDCEVQDGGTETPAPTPTPTPTDPEATEQPVETNGPGQSVDPSESETPVATETQGGSGAGSTSGATSGAGSTSTPAAGDNNESGTNNEAGGNGLATTGAEGIVPLLALSGVLLAASLVLMRIRRGNHAE
ncbi:lamin tail domain-containing protein [Gulosibacter sp. ACHW.36C]|uniref:Lamin tail domain-containing protein n=1 Tax=Gulosibacter sediminis TaxID=1729695 RepID=A0ABY4N1A2_9MICO|nr:lamin tail domain-containing protein [Gulosibacter sediminis]UQN15013.1 lamin tail domain-containing protein [Gulosibacter sediminis]